MSGAIKILHEPKNDEPFVLLYKPSGLASAPLSELDNDNAFAECAKFFPQVKNIQGKKNIEGGLLHRIDTPTSGLLLVAASQDFYNHIMSSQDKGLFIKGYCAQSIIDADNAKKIGAFPPVPFQKKFDDFPEEIIDALSDFTITSFFRPFGKGKKEVRPVLANSNAAALKKIGSKKLYSTKIISAQKIGCFANIECKITQGFRHQVRSHLAWIGLPVRGDSLYNYDYILSSPKSSQEIFSFAASSLEFPDLFSDKIFSFSLKPEDLPFKL